MSRRLRQNLAGMPFHLTARVQNGEDLFVGMERRICRLIRATAGLHGARPAAYAVMANHLHVIAVQGRQPLGWYMHMLLHQVAILVRKRTGRVGHVFQGRYHAVPCLDAEQLRNAVAYVHLNPVRAGLCTTADAFPWTSHGTYCAPAARNGESTFELAAEAMLLLFGRQPQQTVAECRRDYRVFVRWRTALDEFLSAGGDPRDPLAPARPWCVGGDVHWSQAYGERARHAAIAARLLPPKEDLTQLARRVLLESAPDLPLSMLRSGSRARPIVRVRRVVISRALEAGYAGHQLARYFNLSPSAVSTVAVKLRGGR